MFSEHDPADGLDPESTPPEEVAGTHDVEDDERRDYLLATRIVGDEAEPELVDPLVVAPVDPTMPAVDPVDPTAPQVDPQMPVPTFPEETIDVAPVEMNEPSVQQVPSPGPDQSVRDVQVPWPEQPGLEVFDEEDLSTWCEPGLPEDWEAWTPPVEPSPETWTDDGYSTDWGPVDATWPQEGEEVFPTQPEEQQQPLSDVVGPGHLADQYWGYQGQTNYCVLYSAASILGELFGTPPDMNEMVARADAQGWLVRDANGEIQGVMEEHFDDLLASYGVPSHQRVEGEQGAWEDLNTALTNDQRVIVSVDSKEIDAGTNVGTDTDSDHAVAVTGIDYARQAVIVNDSARSAGLEIPMNVFFEAWRDGGFHLTVTDTAMPQGEGAVPPAGSSGLRADAPGYAVMPFTLHLTDTPTLPAP